MKNNVWERVSDCVHPKHGAGVISRRVTLSPLTLKYEYQDGYSEYVRFDEKRRRKVSKYGFLKYFRGKFEPLPDNPLQTVQTEEAAV